MVIFTCLATLFHGTTFQQPNISKIIFKRTVLIGGKEEQGTGWVGRWGWIWKELGEGKYNQNEVFKELKQYLKRTVTNHHQIFYYNIFVYDSKLENSSHHPH